ncbi:hypothetical protein F0L68_11930 [Solihabitans fulvus]|uniref:SipW-cognate class signal peptide n=1 Tax=Solihabitans fulvus TaxID=1892852 RepID=A0A5B2XHC5_9PSEU|nr:hypothetical protein [Solihabitans fulvus]KAA2262606.1 hypothetical protein F0L68_11930 [Solihabitans fulvus]
MSKHSDDKPRKRRRKAMIVGLAIGVGATMLSTAAFAAWDVSGDGTSSDAAATAQKIVVKLNPNPNGDLWPGGTGAAQYSIDNPNGFPVVVSKLTFNSITSGNETNCPAKNLTAVNSTATLATAITVPANSNSGAQSLPAAFKLDTNAPSACQGVVFTVKTSATAVTG